MSVKIGGIEKRKYTYVWEDDEQASQEKFTKYIQQKHPNYRFKYNWDKYPQVKDYIQRLMRASEIVSDEQPKTYGYEKFKNEIPELIHDVEDFFATGIKTGLFTEDALEKIIITLKKRFRYIEFLNDPSLYGNSVSEYIQLNVDYHNAQNLTSKETRKLYMFHEIGHKILGLTEKTDMYKKYNDTVEQDIRDKGRRSWNVRWKTIYRRRLGNVRRSTNTGNGRIFGIYNLWKNKTRAYNA